MITETRKVIVLAALTIATGMAAVELGDGAAQAQTMIMVRDQAYAAARVDTAFDLVASMPATPAVMIPMAMKGDLPVPQGCPRNRGRCAGGVHGRRLRSPDGAEHRRRDPRRRHDNADAHGRDDRCRRA